MPKVQDLKQYYRELAQKAGLAEDVVKQVEAAFENKAFVDGFKPLPDYSHDLDDVRNRAKAEKDEEYKDWYAKEQLKYNEYLAGLDRLKTYETKYGSLDVQHPPDPGRQPGGQVLSQEDIDKLVDAKLSNVLQARDSTYLDYLELREEHLSTFGKPLDRKAFEDAYRQHPEWGSLRAAYKFWTEPEAEKLKEAKFKEEADRRYQEGVRDGFSRRAVPTDHQPKTFSPLFDRKEDVAKQSEGDQERHSREAFFEELRNDNKQPA